MHWQEDASQRTVGLNPAAAEGFFLAKPPSYEHVVVELVLNISVSCIKH